MSRSSARSQPEDLFRKERFGGLYYRRESALFHPLVPLHAKLLLASMDRPAPEVWVEDRDRWAMSESELATQLASWRYEGLLDDDFRCRARVVDGDRSHGALTGPMVTNIQLTRACNLSCDHCFVDVATKPHPDELETEQVAGLFAELEALGSPVVILAGGEPLLRRDFWAIVERLESSGLDAALCSNATLIDEEKAERLCASAIRWFSISMDGPDAALHEAIRGPRSFEKVTNGIAALIRAGADDVKVRVTVTAHNRHRLVEFAQTARELGVHRVVMKPFRHTADFFGFDAHDLYVSRDEYIESTDRCLDAWPDDAPPLHIDDGMPFGLPAWTRVVPAFGCVGGTTHASVIYDGRVVACDAVHDPADWTLHDHTFAECWRQSPTIRSWRTLEGNNECGDCSNGSTCRGGCRARALGLGASINDPDPWAYCSAERPDPRKRLPIIAA